MQNVPGAQGPHGVLTELSVTGAHEVLAAAFVVAPLTLLNSESLIVATGHGAGSASLATASVSASAAESVDADGAVRPEPLPPVSYTFVNPSDTRVKVNFGHTFRVESNVLKFMVIVPPDVV